ncbi:MAG: radical SAM protein, partial [Ruminococcaceae bacterium]|nr:radical SAM protein [Oscillospiraceae bacterium]
SDGVCIGMRHVSVSTCGLVDKIEQLIPMKPQFTLSVSLHAPNDRIRSEMMPVNRRWNVEQLLDVCRRYANATGRRVSYEYSMVSGVNDSEQCARELASRLRGTLCHVNLIPINEVEGSGCKSSSQQSIQRFMQILEQSGITVTRRRTLGSDISASCGQLKRQSGADAQ